MREAAEALLAVPQRILHRAPLGDVGHEQQHHLAAVRPGERGLASPHPHFPPADPVQALVLHGFTGERLLVRVLEEACLLGREHVVVVGSHDFLERAVEEAAEGEVGGDVAMLGILHQDRARNRVDHRVQEIAGLFDLRLGAPLQRDVACDAAVAEEGTMLAEDRRTAHRNDACLAGVADARGQEVAERFVAGDRLVVAPAFGRFHIARQFPAGAAQDLFGADAPFVQGTAGDLREAQVRILFPIPVRRE